jgi:uncharacterized cofD-like protein
MKSSKFGEYVDHLLEAVINGTAPRGEYRSSISHLSHEILATARPEAKVVIFGGGTGLSTVLGGNSRLEDWPQNPFVGLKQEFSSLSVVVCTTDDGGSTGRLLRQLPIIGIGDIRKVLLSLILRENLQKAYPLDDAGSKLAVAVIQSIFNHRFPPAASDHRLLADPLLAAPEPLRDYCPVPLADLLGTLGAYISPGGNGPPIAPEGHCLGNLLLAAAILSSAGRGKNGPPDSGPVARGIRLLSEAIGVTPGLLYPATTTPGQLVLKYSNGIAVRGQSKATATRRLLPIDQLFVECAASPHVDQGILRAIEKADLILFAPGSLYTSIMPILQLGPINRAIRENRKALKILGANFWVQAGETDISRRRRNRGFHVSELIEAYDNNVQGGYQGLFDVVLSANLEHIPGDVIGNYELEGKSPIYLDRHRVEDLGLLPVEATIYSRERLRIDNVIHHDPRHFALAVRALFVAHRHLNLKREAPPPSPQAGGRGGFLQTDSPLLFSYHAEAVEALAQKFFQPRHLQPIMENILWENRDIRIGHLHHFEGVEIIGPEKWSRSKAWDNVLGYYDPEDGLLKVHAHAARDPDHLCANLLTALGESLLGRYIETRRWVVPENGDFWGMRRYEIRLRPVRDRGCFLDDPALRRYLRLARMLESPRDPRLFAITLNDQEGFIPPGLLFGLLYAWYLNNAYAGIMEHEMSLLRRPPEKLIPCQFEEYRRKKELIRFFRDEVFMHVVADRT